MLQTMWEPTLRGKSTHSPSATTTLAVAVITSYQQHCEDEFSNAYSLTQRGTTKDQGISEEVRKLLW